MIERMKKISLLIYHSSRTKFLDNLQSLGVIHLEANKNIQNEDILKYKDQILRLRKNEKTLFEIQKQFKKKIKQADYKENIDYIMDKVESLRANLDKAQNELDNVYKEISQLEPWGYFNPEIFTVLENKGIKVKFFVLKESKFKKMTMFNIACEVISKRKGNVHFAVFYHKDEVIPEFDISEIKIPLKNKQELEKLKFKYEDEIKNLEYGLYEYTRFVGLFKKEIVLINDNLEYSIAQANLTEEVKGKVLVITGWMPKKKLKPVEEFLAKQDVYYLLEDPAKTDNVPILLKNGPIASLFEPIMKIFSLPSYFELDTTVFLAPFFALFFGLCQADIGYGALLFVVTLLAVIFVKGKAGKKLALLGMILSIMVIFGGVMLNGILGFNAIDILIVKYKILPEDFKKYFFFANRDDAMILAIFLGVVQVLFAYILKTVNQIRSNGFQGGLMPIGNFFLLFGLSAAGIGGFLGKEFKIGPMLIGKLFFIVEKNFTFGNITFNFPLFLGIASMCFGTLLILFFNNIDKKIYVRPLLGLWEMYGNATGIPGDILSYLRLFALGLSGGLLGGAVNDIAMMAKGDSNSIIAFVLMFLVMIFGHGLNLMLSLLGSFVHPLRLTFVEFYKNVGFSGGGIEYSPFSLKYIKKK